MATNSFLPLSSFPRCGNGLSKPLDSGLRRNDGGGWGQEFIRNSKGAVGVVINPFLPCRHSSEGWNPGGEAGGGEGGKVYPMARSVVVPVVGIPALREWLM